jgi:hypothetical protein
LFFWWVEELQGGMNIPVLSRENCPGGFFNNQLKTRYFLFGSTNPELRVGKEPSCCLPPETTKKVEEKR